MNSAVKKKLVVVIDNEVQVEYDREKELPPHQIEYLEKMDAKMDQGIPQGSGHIFSPNPEKKAEFIANQLVSALKSNNEQLAAATLAWLANRIPDLQQVVAEDKDGQTEIRLINDRAYAKEEPVQFIRPGQLDS